MALTGRLVKQRENYLAELAGCAAGPAMLSKCCPGARGRALRARPRAPMLVVPWCCCLAAKQTYRFWASWLAGWLVGWEWSVEAKIGPRQERSQKWLICDNFMKEIVFVF